MTNKKTSASAPEAPFFDEEEAQLIAELEETLDNDANSIMTAQRQQQLELAAKRTLSPRKTQISTRLASHDLAGLKAKALEMGMPYQTLLASIVHRYVHGRLVERD